MLVLKIIVAVICIVMVAIIIHAAESMSKDELAAWMGDDDYCKDMDAK